MTCILAVFALTCAAQETRGTISGTITDQQGASIPNAAVKITNHETGIVTSTKTNESGIYVAPFIAIGDYVINASAQGFKASVRDGVNVRVGDRLQIDFKLEVGSMSEQVTVTAEADLLETSSANKGQVIDSAKVADLPLLGRNPFLLAAISTGVQYTATQASRSNRPFDNGGMDNMQINGGPGTRNEYLLDGVPDTNTESSGPANLSFVPSPDATSEFKVQTNTYDAQYGRTGGGTVNVSLKSGTNKLHGAAYWYFRHDKLNANTFEANMAGTKKSSSRWAQPGIEVDGPVVIPHLYDGRNRTFFMYSWEKIKSSIPYPQNYSVPSAAQRNGDFSTTYQSNGSPITIYDPLTTALSGSSYVRTPFSNNLIPSTRIDAVSKKMLDYIPTGNVAGTVQGLQNLIVAPNPRTDTYDQHIIRIDQVITNKHKFFSRYVRGNRHEVNEYAAFPEPSSPWYTHWRTNQGGNFDLTSTLSPTLVSVFRAGYIRHQFAIARYGSTFDLTKLGYSSAFVAALPRSTFPQVTMTDYTTIGNTGSQYTFSDTWSISETLNKVFGRHSLKFGVELRRMFNNQTNPASYFGTYTFTKGWTQYNALNGDSASGNAIASMLLGTPGSATSYWYNAYAFKNNYAVGFIQDDWRVSSRLTVNLGLRWDYESPQTERFNRLNTGFNATGTPSMTVSGLTLKGGLTFASDKDRLPFIRDTNNWQPRIGVSYQLAPKTVLRGGWGISYMPTFEYNGTNGYSMTTTMNTSLDGLTPYTYMANPYPSGLATPVGSTKGLDTLMGGSYTYGYHDRTIPYTHQFSFGIQHELPWRLLLDVSYAGNRTFQLPTSKSINEISVSDWAQGATKLASQVTNPFAGLLPGTSLNSSTVAYSQMLRPYPQFLGITEAYRPLGKLTYNALQIRIEKRLTNGFHLLASYTYSKTQEATGYLNSGQDSFGSMARVVSSYDTPQRLIFSGGWSLPFFKSHPNPFVRQILGGWDMNSIVTFQSGLPVSAPSSTFSTGVNAKLDSRTNARWFNTCTLTTAGVRQNCASTSETPAWQIMPAYTLRTLSSYLSNIRTQRAPLADFSMFKTFAIYEQMKLQFRAEAFNLTNSVWFGSPNTTVTSSSFGVVTTAQSNDPRNVQLALRLVW